MLKGVYRFVGNAFVIQENFKMGDDVTFPAPQRSTFCLLLYYWGRAEQQVDCP